MKLSYKNKELPKITCELIDNPDGSCDLKCEYDENFVAMVKDKLYLVKTPTKKQISKFILDSVKEAIVKVELAYLLDMMNGDYIKMYDILTQEDWREKGYLKNIKRAAKKVK